MDSIKIPETAFQIKYSEYLKALRSYGTAVNCEDYIFLREYVNTPLDQVDSEENCNVYYYDRGCMLSVMEYGNNADSSFVYTVIMTSHDSPILDVADTWLKIFDRQVANAGKPSFCYFKLNYVAPSLPEFLDKYYGWRCFSRHGFHAAPDPRVRELTKEDAEIIREMCRISSEGDTNFGKQLATNISEFDFDFFKNHIKVYGIFEGNELAGVATSKHAREIDVAFLCDVFVAQKYRNRGLGRALVISALSEYPDKKWVYQSARDNHISINLAKSLGFSLEGAHLLLR